MIDYVHEMWPEGAVFVCGKVEFSPYVLHTPDIQRRFTYVALPGQTVMSHGCVVVNPASLKTLKHFPLQLTCCMRTNDFAS